MFDILTTTPEQEAKAIMLAINIAGAKANHDWNVEQAFVPEWAAREGLGYEDTYRGVYREAYVNKARLGHFLEAIKVMGMHEKSIVRRASKEVQYQYEEGLITLLELACMIVDGL